MVFVFLKFFIASIYFLLVGIIGNKYLFNENLKTNRDYFEFSLIGIILTSFLAFLINFFVSLNLIVNDIFFILPFLIIIFLRNKNLNIIPSKLLFFALASSIIATILISYDNVYRPDAGLYHLPYISIISENKLIIGLSNLHFRFGHTSILQYLSASFNNHLFFENGILIPAALIFSFIIIFLIYLIFTERDRFLVFLSFVFLSFIFFRMNRYSSFGNDAPAHFYYIYLLICALRFSGYNNYQNFFNKISLISIFIFFNKITMVVAFFVPAIFIFNKNFLRMFSNKIFLSLILVFCLWIGKNILNSGCMAFPIEQTCIKSLNWFDKSETRRSNAKSGRIENEAWTKGAPHQNKKTFEEYISTIEWINIWNKNHGKKIIEKITPFLIFFLFILMFLLYKEKINNSFREPKLIKNKIIWLLIFINFIGSLIWFFKFPVFRYGYGYLIGLFGIILSFVVNNIIDLNIDRFKKIAKYIIILLFIGVSTKYSIRIKEKFSINASPWPNIYSDTKDNLKFKYFKNYDNKNNLIFYTPELTMCYYSNFNPCTHLAGSEFKTEEIKFEKIYGYKKYSFK